MTKYFDMQLKPTCSGSQASVRDVTHVHKPVAVELTTFHGGEIPVSQVVQLDSSSIQTDKNPVVVDLANNNNWSSLEFLTRRVNTVTQ